VTPDSSGHISLSFGSLSGQNYQMQYTDDLSNWDWTSLGSPVPGTGSTLTILDDMLGQSQRFYRLVLLP